MQIVIRSTQQQKNELANKGFNENVIIQWIEPGMALHTVNADVYFDLAFNDIDPANNEFINDKPVFAHAVNCTCREINKSNYIRLNAWNSFLNRPVTELVCCKNAMQATAEKIFHTLGWKPVFVADEYGFIAARILAMIISEAYYALEENVSTKEQIDIAMKLGTNYSLGPFEWSEKIGLNNILHLLQRLKKRDERYTIPALLVHESQQF